MQAAASPSARLTKVAVTSMSPSFLTARTKSASCFRNGVTGSFRNRRYFRHHIGSLYIQSHNRTTTVMSASTSAALTPSCTMSYSSLPSLSTLSTQVPTATKIAMTHQLEKKIVLANYHRHFASGSLWDTFGNVMDGIIPTRTNPIIDFITMNNNSHQHEENRENKQQQQLLPNFSNVQARHIQQACTQILQQYEQEWSALQQDFLDQSSSATSEVNNIIATRYQQITLPLVNLLRISQLLQKLCGGEGDHGAKIYSTCEHVIDQLRDKMEQTDAAIALWQQENIPTSNNDDGDGTVAEQEKMVELSSLQKRLDELEKPFLISAHDGSVESNQSKRMSPRKAIPLMYEILAVQCRIAEIMNEKSWADCHLDTSVDEILELHHSLESALNRFDSMDKSEDEDEETVELETGNEGFELRKYLKLDTVLDGLFLLSRNLFGVIIVEVPSNEVKGWHRDVKLYHVYNEEENKDGLGDYLGSFYFDLYKRMEKGTDRAFTCALVDDFMFDGGNSELQQDDETKKKKPTPLLCVNCNMSPPLWDDSPAYPSLDDVQELFHEFGHVLHDVLKIPSTVDEKNSGGGNDNEITEEFLPQLMENWVYEPSVLTKCTAHHESSEPMPPSLISQLNQQRQSAKRNELRNRLFLGALELELHSAYDPKSSENDESIVAMQKRFAEKYLPQNALMKGDITPLMQIFEASAEGKRTAQHRYLIADVLAADAFQSFRKALDGGDGEEIRRLGKLIRQTILEVDGGERAISSFVRGGEDHRTQEEGSHTDTVNAKAYMQSLGLMEE